RRHRACPGLGEYARVLTLSHIFFFSSRRRHTRFSRDWSSDVCSSDLRLCASRRCDPDCHVPQHVSRGGRTMSGIEIGLWSLGAILFLIYSGMHVAIARSEERRVGKESRSWSSPDDQRETKARQKTCMN